VGSRMEFGWDTVECSAANVAVVLAAVRANVVVAVVAANVVVVVDATIGSADTIEILRLHQTILLSVWAGVLVVVDMTC
jgi:hypothetical protein